MPRVKLLLSLHAALLAVVASSGCTNLMTARAIQTFADGVATGNLELVKASASDEFDAKALRQEAALEDLKILRLPKGKVSVSSIENISPTEKKVTVEVGETKRRLLYKLVRDPQSKEWLVDDIYLKQRKSGEEKAITKSVTETMDLLLTVREFLDAWETGGREEVLEITTPGLRELLADLSPVHLQQLTSQVVGKEQQGSYRPEARIEKNRAVVMLPRVSGKLLIELSLGEGGWRVNDVAVDARNKDHQVRSTRRMAYILQAAGGFLTAYEQADLEGLEEVTTEAFYRNTLAVADLSTVAIPTVRLLTTPYSVRVHDNQADLIIESPAGTYMLTMIETDPGTYVEKVGSYQVSEVTVYDGDDSQVKRLSAMFTAQSIVEIFSKALATRDIARLKQASTAALNRTVWDHVDAELLNSLPMDQIEAEPPRIVETVFQGAVTEITVTQGSRALTYVLRDSNGRMVVDDVLLPVVDRPHSLRQNLQAMIPVYGMARAFFHNDITAARQHSSRRINKRVWEPLSGMPELGIDPIGHFTLPMTALAMTEDRADVTLSDEQGRQTQLTLTRTDNRFVIDEAVFITGPDRSQRVQLSRAGRLDLAAGQQELK